MTVKNKFPIKLKKELRFKDIRFEPHWEFKNPETGFEYISGVIPGILFFTSISGNAYIPDVVKALTMLPDIYDKGSFQDKQFIRIVDYSGLKKSSLAVRKYYAKILKELNEQYNCSPQITYICGASRANKAILRLFASVAKQHFIFVNSVDNAFKHLHSNSKIISHRSRLIKVSQKDINEIYGLCGDLLWDTIDDTGECKVSPDNPLHQLEDSLAVVKESIIELRENDIHQTESLKTVFESIQAGLIIVDAQSHVILFANAAAAAMAQTTPEAMTDKLCYSFICPAQMGACPMNDQGKEVENVERILLRSDGSEVPVLKSVKRLDYQGLPCFLETFIDITEMKQAQFDREKYLEELENSHAVLLGMIEDIEVAHAETLEVNEQLTRVKQAVDASGDAISIFTIDGHHIYQNETFSKLFGYKLEEFETLHPKILYSNKETSQAMFKTIIAGDSFDSEVEMVDKGGRLFPVHLRANAVKDGGGKVIGFIGVYTDVTERKLAEERLEKTNKMLNEAIQQANQMAFEAEIANDAKSEFLANMSHEIRTPMNGIIGMTDLALETDLNVEQMEYLNMVRSSADTLLELINDILDFSKIEVGKMEMEIMEFNLLDTLEKTTSLLAPEAHEKGLEFMFELDSGVDTVLVGDPTRLKQILLNLMKNAIKFTEKGHVLLKVIRESDHEDEEEPESLTLHFTIEDTGIGISEENQEQIFNPFTQADGSTSRKFGGTGLGLTISQRLVSLMGGKIWVESRFGKGSEFHFTTQFIKPVEDEDHVCSKDKSILDNKRVLVVDDNIINSNILKKILLSWNMIPEVVNGWEECLNLFNRPDFQSFDIVLLDYQMPGKSGLQLAKELIRNHISDDTVVMMLTSLDLASVRKKCLEEGFEVCLVKPICPSELMDAMMNTIGSPLLSETADQEREVDIDGIEALRGKHVLLAEDNEINSILTTKMLQKIGIIVETATNGAEVLEILRLDTTFDLIFMDIQMPIMDGVEATGRIREIENATGEHIPIIALTAHAMDGVRERLLNRGMDDYLSKPIKAKELYSVITENILKNRADSNRFTEPDPNEYVNTSTLETPTFAPMEISELSERVSGNEELVRELLQLFIDTSPDIITDIKEALKKRDANALEFAAHKLKGSSANIGATQVRKISSELEMLGHSGDVEPALLISLDIDKEFDRTIRWIREYLASA